MPEIRIIPVEGFKRVVEAWDASIGFHCFIAVHDCTLGPSLGGVRIFPYGTREDALHDALRLAEGMTYKSALAQLGLGGGKSVIIADPKRQKSPALLTAFAEVINALDGEYITAEDLGSTVEDMALIGNVSPYVVGLSGAGRCGDPSRFTAYGVLQGMKAVAKMVKKTTSLRGLRIAIQGMGHVGSKLAEMLFWEGAELVISDINRERVEEIAAAVSATTATPESILQVECDILAPCALGGVINDTTLPLFRCAAIAGAANNQLERLEHGAALIERNILYAPDYVINSGGILTVIGELSPTGYSAVVARNRTEQIFHILSSIFELSLKENKATSSVANELAERYLREGISRREGPLYIAGKQVKQDCRATQPLRTSLRTSN